mmetsp:Transcript_59710/g.139074  ORF Transcript_59710/g.139074 Transcript_59710/m.139074 type:complete len:240 (+) Transcript_59710:66-785(+)
MASSSLALVACLLVEAAAALEPLDDATVLLQHSTAHYRRGHAPLATKPALGRSLGVAAGSPLQWMQQVQSAFYCSTYGGYCQPPFDCHKTDLPRNSERHKSGGVHWLTSRWAGITACTSGSGTQSPEALGFTGTRGSRDSWRPPRCLSPNCGWVFSSAASDSQASQQQPRPVAALAGGSGQQAGIGSCVKLCHDMIYCEETYCKEPYYVQKYSHFLKDAVVCGAVPGLHLWFRDLGRIK